MPRDFILRYRWLRSNPNNSAVLVTLPAVFIKLLEDVIPLGRLAHLLKAACSFRSPFGCAPASGPQGKCAGHQCESGDS